MPKILAAPLLLVLLLVACTADPVVPSSSAPEPTRPSGSGTTATSTPLPGASADRLLFWARCDQVSALTDADLDRWQDMGVDGFVCALQALTGLGGNVSFTTAPGADLAADEFAAERRLRDSAIGTRARQRGMKLYLSFYFANESNVRTPLLEWFDDSGWSNVVVPRVREMAAVAHGLGFAGLGFDLELYPQANNVLTASWAVGYPGSTRSGDEVRAQVKRRGAQLMQAILEGFPGVEIVAYGTQFPETWEQEVQREVNNIPDPFGQAVQLDLWDGLTSVDGWSSIRLLNATFYKTAHLRNVDWDEALRFQYSRLYSLLSRRLSNWDYAASRFNESPFIWINSGTTAFEAARSPEYVADQLDAFSRWGMGGEFANYAHDGLSGFDYGPYVAGMQAASTPRVVISTGPTLSVEAAAPAGGKVELTGRAADSYAVRYVRWEAGNASGMARMVAVLVDGAKWRMDWSASVPLAAGVTTVTVTAESIKGLSTTQKVSLEGAS